MRGIIATLGVFSLIVGITLWSYRGELAMMLFKNLSLKRIKNPPVFEDGLHAVICGAGSPLPDEGRTGPCTMVIAGDRKFIVDTGTNSARRLARMGFRLTEVEAVLLTHFHSDHIDGLGEVLLQRWAGGEPSSPLPVYGGEGVEKVVKGFNDAYLLDKGYRVKHHGSSVIIPSSFGGVAKPFDISSIVEDYTKRVVVLQDDDLQIVAFSVRHEPIKPAVGFKFIYKGKTLVISGDTSKVDSVAREAKDVDLLIHEGLSPRLLKILEQNFESVGNGHLRQIMYDINDYHTFPEDVASIAQESGAHFLVYNHIVPVLPFMEALEKAWLGDAPAIYHGPIAIARDGDVFSLYLTQDKVHVSHLDVGSPLPPITGPVIGVLVIMGFFYYFGCNRCRKRIPVKTNIQ